MSSILRSSVRMLFGCLAFAACASAQSQSAVDFVEDRHELAIGDTVSIEFPHRPDFNRDVVLRTDGRITLPLVGTIKAAGLAPEELEAEVRARYATLVYQPTAQGPAEKKYLINVDDVLDVRFRDVAALNATVQVRPDGRISLDLVKSVIAEGKTPEQLESELIQQYARFLQSPELVVVVRKYTSDLVSVDGRMVRPGLKNLEEPVVIVRSSSPRLVYVAGEVRAPGFQTYRPALTAVQAIIASGGFLATAAGGRVVLLRKTGVETPSAAFLDLNADLKGRGSNDVALRPFDIVVVPKSKIASIDQALDQYVYQLIPASRNVNFTFFYDLAGRRIP